jgi:hypothetical protein
MHVSVVGKPSYIPVPLKNRWFLPTAERNHMEVRNVRKPSFVSTVLILMKELTLERNPMDESHVRNPLKLKSP